MRYVFTHSVHAEGSEKKIFSNSSESFLEFRAHPPLDRQLGRWKHVFFQFRSLQADIGNGSRRMEGAANTAALANQAAHDTNARIRLLEHLDARHRGKLKARATKLQCCRGVLSSPRCA